MSCTANNQRVVDEIVSAEHLTMSKCKESVPNGAVVQGEEHTSTTPTLTRTGSELLGSAAPIISAPYDLAFPAMGQTRVDTTNIIHANIVADGNDEKELVTASSPGDLAALPIASRNPEDEAATDAPNACAMPIAKSYAEVAAINNKTSDAEADKQESPNSTDEPVSNSNDQTPEVVSRPKVVLAKLLMKASATMHKMNVAPEVKLAFTRTIERVKDALAAGTMSIKSALKSIAKFMLETKRKVGETVKHVFRRRQQEKRNDEEKEVADEAKEDVPATEQKQVMDLPVQDSAVDLQDEEWSVVSGKKGAPEQDAAEDSAKDDEEEYAEDSDEYMAKVLGAHKKTSMDERIAAMDKLAPPSPLTPASHRVTVYDPTTGMVKLEAGF